MEEMIANLKRVEAMLGHLTHTVETLQGEVRTRLGCIEDHLELLDRQQAKQEAYSTEDFARLVDKESYTVREWCRLGRVRGTKRPSGRGNSKEWMIPHEELVRYRREGLLPFRRA